MPLTPLDGDRLREALALAEQSIGLSDPNPRVGCIIGREDGTLLGRGYTQEAGGPHAEIVALRDAKSAGGDVRGATAWVTLEPCAHHGRTPPCCDALIAAGVARVVVAVGDPSPLVAGGGLARLRAAGIDVSMADEQLARAARELNVGFFSRIERGRPWVRMKVAISLDGRTALQNGVSQWITGEAARADGHAWRRRAGAILTGVGTVLADNPRLDVRLVPTRLQPLRVVLDSTLRMPTGARLLLPPGKSLIVGGKGEPERRAALEAQGAEVLLLPDRAGRADIDALLVLLAAREVNEAHVEAGPTLNGALLAGGLVDELLVYQAPLLIGPGHTLATLPALTRLLDAPRFRIAEVAPCGGDLRLRLTREPSTFLTDPTRES
ncbi:MAG: bifunctional diaminohydroxyphosphoribosylaminopyrimidine deaminase/5-amino-6-(5-phosphoribosylamino)uracil reductase RibD [Zoogloea sp.]|jgi:diaminohydroxyphosphoribosylaminopyrimidine deaminase/5-amino-6-(5-phosphoribosylamino)uracil reductase|nr:bifunctional diaminohydroxyphosphoribosylaminopyrimidine deaminase/5-amino-6-(5-phosphoribosylamino)uracil reductase RibD [Zoogloea sp.]